MYRHKLIPRNAPALTLVTGKAIKLNSCVLTSRRRWKDT